MFVGLFVVVLFAPFSPQRSYLFNYSEIFSYFMVAVATAGRLWCAIYILGNKSNVLCQDGPYSLCRNPLYLFSFMGGMGMVSACNHIGLIIGFLSISCFYYFLVIKSEERRLLQIFGREYESYCARTHRFMPDFRNYWSRKQMAINPQLILHAIIKNMWFFWLLCVMEIIKTIKRIPG